MYRFQGWLDGNDGGRKLQTRRNAFHTNWRPKAGGGAEQKKGLEGQKGGAPKIQINF